MSDEVQISPRVDEDLAECYRDFVTYINDGKYRGFFGSEMETALGIQMAFELSEQEKKDLLSEDVFEYIDEVSDEFDISNVRKNDGVRDVLEYCEEGEYENAWSEVCRRNLSNENFRTLVDLIRAYEELEGEIE